MILLAGFLEVLFRGFIFIGMALSVGGLMFRAAVLGRTRAFRLAETQRRSLSLIALGAFAAAAFQFLSLVITPWALADDTGSWPLGTFLSTGYAQAGLLRAILSLGFGVAALAARREPRSPLVSGSLWALAALVLASGAWLVHGTSRMEYAGLLMALTVFHQWVTATWIGGTIHLVAQWRLLRGRPDAAQLWPELPARFSPLAMTTVSLLLASGAFLGVRYVGSLGGLFGTAYGTMLLTKLSLTAAALGLGGMSFRLLRDWKRAGATGPVLRRVPVLIETEAAIGAIIFMAAAALTGQPPSIDAADQQASLSEVVRVFAPKKLQLLPAPLAKLNADAPGALDPYAATTELDRIQSNFNHNVSGLFVLLIGLGAFAQLLTRAPASRHWPLLFLPFWLFLVLFAQPTGWPLGTKGFWESLFAADVLTHRIGTLLVAALGVFEWRVQRGCLGQSRWRYAFPILCLAGGGLLLGHSHSLSPNKAAYLIEVSHNALGVLAALVGAGSWLELRSDGATARYAGLLWRTSFVLVGLVLIAYQEA